MRTKFAERESERLDVATEMKTQTGTTRGFSWHVRLPRNTEHVVFGSQLWLRAPLPRFTVTRVGSSWNPSLSFDAHPHLVHPDLHDALAADPHLVRRDARQRALGQETSR